MPKKSVNICRFCLCEDEVYLLPIKDAAELSITIEDVVRFSGVQINEDGGTEELMCLECTNKLQICTTFRSTSLSNDAKFHELRDMLEASSKEPIDIIELSDSSESSFDLDAFDENYTNTKLNQSFDSTPVTHCTTLPTAPENTRTCTPVLPVTEAVIDTLANDDVFAYSANYIAPGEIVYTEDVIHKSFIDWNNSLNPPLPQMRYVGERRKRKLHLCETCGATVHHIKSHCEKHAEQPTYSCPHCPTKTMHRYTIKQHIEQVHLRKPVRKCEICGQQFIHRKTYRYHMFTHESNGKTFECVDCSKTFPNAVYLRDHYNRLHNPAKKNKRRHTEGKVRRKRNRSRIVKDSSDSE